MLAALSDSHEIACHGKKKQNIVISIKNFIRLANVLKLIFITQYIRDTYVMPLNSVPIQ